MSKKVQIIYGILFITLIVHPHINTGHFFPIAPSYVQSLINLFLVVIGVGIYFFHQRDIRRKETEKKQVEQELDISSQKLVDAFKYIGRANRRLPLLKNLTSDLLARHKPNKKAKKNILDGLLNTAVVSIAKTDWGMFRFLNITNENIIKEVVYTEKNYTLLKTQISNKELLELRQKSNRVKKINDLHILVTSDYKTDVPCFIILPGSKLSGSDESVLQAIVDQAQLFYQYLYNN